MNTLNKIRTQDNQQVAVFTGDGAYVGSSKPKSKSLPRIEVEENKSTSFALRDPFEPFYAEFANLYEIKESLGIPSQQEIQDDAVSFVWAPFDVALREAGPLTQKVLQAMQPHLERKKKFVYIDSKIQYFKKGDIAVDNNLWHVDGSIAVRDERATNIGYPLLHDMLARFDCSVPPPTYMAYQSSVHCATQFVKGDLAFTMPACIPSFDSFNALVEAQHPVYVSQPAGSIVKFNGFSVHRAIPAEDDGWRLWIRCTETDREIRIDPSMINCYGSVFRR